MCQITGQEVANASMYDGSTALTEAVLMAERLTSRRQILVARSRPSRIPARPKTDAKNLDREIEDIGYTASGQLHRAALKPETLHAHPQAVVVQSPTSSAAYLEIPARPGVAHGSGALAGHRQSPKPFWLGIVPAARRGRYRPAIGEAEAFGIPPSYGGPYARRDRHTRKIRAPDARSPRRTNLQTPPANRGFRPHPSATREQHIRREKATSNICTNEALYALAATFISPDRQRRLA